MAPELASLDETKVRLYAENVAEVLLNGISLHDGSRPPASPRTDRRPQRRR
jgi:hypothetical protein